MKDQWALCPICRSSRMVKYVFHTDGGLLRLFKCPRCKECLDEEGMLEKSPLSLSVLRQIKPR